MTQITRFDPAVAHQMIMEHYEGRPGALDDALLAIEPLARVVVGMLEGDPERVSEYVQECLIKVWHELGKYDRNPSRLRAWLWSVIHNHTITLWRQNNPLETVPLFDEIVAEDERDREELPDTTPDIALELADHLVTRFPDVKKIYLRLAAEISVDALSGGKSAKSTIKEIRQRLFPSLRSSQVVIVFYAAVVWLRIRSFSPAYLEEPPPDAVTWSLVPELRTIVGEHLSKVLYTLFRGGSIHFRVN